MALLLFGSDKSDKLCPKQIQRKVQGMLIDHFDIRPENILTVTSEDKKTTTHARFLSKISEVKERMKTRQGNFLFYFIGYNDMEYEQLRLGDIREDCVTHEELKDRLGEIKAPNKLFIIDTNDSEVVNLLPFSMDEERDSNVLQWRFFKDENTVIGTFTDAILGVLTRHGCDYSSCKNLPQNVFVSITDLQACVCQHVCEGEDDYDDPTPNLKFSRASKCFYTFPLIAKVISMEAE